MLGADLVIYPYLGRGEEILDNAGASTFHCVSHLAIDILRTIH